MPSKGIFALIGRNGASKTTLTRILATELLPTSGAATINGIDVMKDPKKLRELIAVLPAGSEGNTMAHSEAEHNIIPALPRLRPQRSKLESRRGADTSRDQKT